MKLVGFACIDKTSYYKYRKHLEETIGCENKLKWVSNNRENEYITYYLDET